MVKVLSIMGRNKHIILPALQRVLVAVGENIRFARLRRKFSAAMVSERAGITRNTLRAIERGDPSVAFGSYANVLFCLGLEKDLKLLAYDDELGRKLQDAGFLLKERAPRFNKKTDPVKKKDE